MLKEKRQRAERSKIHEEIRRNLLTIKTLAEEIIALADSGETQSKHMITRAQAAESILRRLRISALP